MPGFDPGDVVVVPFPFTDREASKRRPALVCSTGAFNRATNHVVLAMITTATHTAWSRDVHIADLDAAGLSARSVVRWKIFTLDSSFVLRRAGALSQRDRAECKKRLPIGV